MDFRDLHKNNFMSYNLNDCNLFSSFSIASEILFKIDHFRKKDTKNYHSWKYLGPEKCKQSLQTLHKEMLI